MRFLSPRTGAALVRDGHALCAAGERWPIVDDIAFLRADRVELADAALARLDMGDAAGASVLLLGDQDDWARSPPPSLTARHELVATLPHLNFREAMNFLALGPVATYFAHRWSDPTFLSGMALAQAYWPSPRMHVFELACGAGHYLRLFGSGAAGGDLVFAKLWLARHFVAPDAQLVCFDASKPWPIADIRFDAVFCHDAFYFLQNKPLVSQEMMRVGTRVLVGHMHNALVENLSPGEPLSPHGYASLFPGCVLFDDSELTDALIGFRTPVATPAARLAGAQAVALAWPGDAPSSAVGALTNVLPGRVLQRNPLYRNGNIAWPSERYAREYGVLATYPHTADAPEHAIAGQSAAVDAMAHRRILLDLPERW